MPPLHTYVSDRLGHAHRELGRSLEGVTEAEAWWGVDANWRRERFGVGLDGSIAGIVWHVAAWKHVIADGLEGGGFPDAEAVLPHDFGWSGMLEWLRSGHARMARLLEENSEREGWLETLVTLEGERLSVLEVLGIVIEHDHYHAGQVNLLRQQFTLRQQPVPAPE